MFKNIINKLRNKPILVVLVLLFLVANVFIITRTFTEKTTSTVWDGKVASKFTRGDGTTIDPYVISNGSELAYFFKLINGDNSQDYFNKNYELSNNINLDGKDFSFAKFNKTFSGTFDGKGYSIFNFKISDYYLNSEENTASFSLFGSLYNANIKNVNFKNIRVNVKDDIYVTKEVSELDDTSELEKVEINKDDIKVDTENEIKKDNNEVESNLKETISLRKFDVTFVNDDENDSNSLEETENIDNKDTTTESSDESKKEDDSKEKEEVKEEPSEPETKEEENTQEKTEDKQDEQVNNTEETTEEQNTNEETNKTDETTNYESKEEETKEEPKDNIVEDSTKEEEKKEEPKKEEDLPTEQKDDDGNKESTEETEKTEEETKTEEKPLTVEVKVDNINISLFEDIENSTLKNINVTDFIIEYNADKEILHSSLFMLNDKGSNTFENINVSGSSNNEDTKILVDSYNGSILKNIMFESSKLSLLDAFDYTKKIDVYEYSVKDGNAVFENKKTLDGVIEIFNKNSTLPWVFENGEFRIVNGGRDKKTKKAALRGAKRSTISEHATGKDGSTIYINDLTSDLNYFEGLNYAEVRNTSIPSGTNTGYYDPEYLVKAEIIYDGEDLNNSSRVGAISPIGENENKLVYFKYIPLVRNSNGSLATNSDGDNYIRIELIDNPFSKRPYVNSVEYGFNGWTCNQDDDTTADVCENSKIIFSKSDYTRYMEVPISGGSEVVIHLNATWYEADVTTSYNNISYFNSMTMVSTGYTVPEIVVHRASYFWRRNYTQMEFDRTYVRGDADDGYMPAGSFYRNNRNSGTYYYNRNRTRCGRNATCYVFTPNTSAIVGGTKYEGGSYTFIANFNATGSNSETTINTHNTTYMELLDDPDGNYSYNETVQRQKSYIPTGSDTQGFYYKVSNPTTPMIQTGEYYTSNGTLCTSASSCTTAYKLIRYNDAVNKSNGNTISIIEEDANNEVINGANYYYLVTRDLNIYRYTTTNNTTVGVGYLEHNVPYTITGTAVNGTSTSGIISVNNNDFSIQNDLVIENIKIYGPNKNLNNSTYEDIALGGDSKTSGVIYSNSNNVKIGRNVTCSRGASYLCAESIFGGANTSSVSGTFRIIVESGNYYAYHSGVTSGNSNYTLNETTIFGSDYDRALSANTKLRFTIGLDGYAGGHNNAGSASLFVSFNIIKSGTFGYNYDGTPNEDNTAGLYIGGRSSKCVNSITGAKIEGGNINTVVGGYAYNGTSTTNSTFIGMSGGSVRSIYGGAGHSTTTGNRILCITGGTVSYSILGGSDSYNSGDTNDGIVEGSTLVYVGGSISVGGGTGKLYGVESGSVFGAGGGDTSSTQKGTVYNSHVIINGGTISTSVYGGGNYGSTGTQASSTSTAKIEVLKGTIGSVYGGSRSADFSKSSYQTSSTIDIDIKGGTIGNVYGGSNRSGIIYGTIDIDITAGTITGNVYGGGRGGAESADPPDPATTGTFTRNGVSVTIGDSSGGPTISGNVYGGSAFGSVNDTNRGNVTVTVNKGTVTGSVFGGGQGDSSHTPIVNGTINVTVNGGTVGKVFGGHDQAGSHTKQNEVHLNGGTVTDAFGGGNKSSVTTTHVYLAGSSVTNIYGGSNTLGNVTTANVNVSSGSATTIYGGNNEGGTCGTTNIEVTGGSLGTIYGGGNLVNTTTTNIDIYNHTGTITAIYGGGNQAGATTTNVDLHTRSGSNTINVTNVYGGSNQSGDVTTSHITVDKGTVTNLYGGNNAGGKTVTTNIVVNGGTITTTFGGGNEAVSDDTNITANGGTFTTIYGGGNKAAITNDTTVLINSATVNGTIFGGGNEGNVGGDTNVTIANLTNTVTAVYGGGNKAGATNTNVTLVTLPSGSNNINITSVFGGSNQSGNVTTSNVNVNKGTITNLYGGNNAGGKTTTPNVTVNGGTITTAYGGGNEAVTDYTNFEANGGTFTNVYGGGNAATVTYNTQVDINSARINTALFGGGNAGAVNGSTTVNVKNLTSTLPALYGGGNAAGATTTNVNLIKLNSGNNNINITSVFGGSNQSGNVTTSNIDIDKGTITNIYGGNNAGGKTTTTNIDISDGTHGTLYGGGNQAVSDETNVDVTGGTFTTVFGGGNAAGITNDVNVNIANATISSNVFGGGNQGDVGGNVDLTIEDTTIANNLYGGGNQGDVGGNITISSDGVTISDTSCNVADKCNIYGGGNAGDVTGNISLTLNETTVGNSTCTYINSCTVYGGGNQGAVGGNITLDTTDSTVKTNLYGGGNQGAVGGSVTLSANGTSVGNDNCDDDHPCSLFGGGNFGAVSGNTDVTLESTTVTNSVYAGGNGNTAIVMGNTTITTGGTTIIGTSDCVLLSACSLFGSGNAAATGTNANNNKLATVNVAGATVYGNVYGGANTSKVFGATYVNIGDDVVLPTGVTQDDISIHGTVFGGGEANADGDDTYDWTFISVTQGINVNINGNGYNNFEILGSIFGSGNASTASGTSEVMIKNYGTFANPKKNISIQRTDLVTIDNSAMILVGATDRENEYSTVLFSLSRIGELDLKNNSTLFLETGANLLEEFKSLKANGNLAKVTIDTENGTVDVETDNRIYMFVDKKLNIAKDQNVTDYGAVSGMTFFGMYKYNQNGTINTGIYDKHNYGDHLDWGDMFFNVTSYVLGLHKNDHDIKVDGFYSNFIDEATETNAMNYIDPIPPTGPLYMWTIGQGVIEYEIDLSASKYSTLGTYELSLTDFTDPNTSFEIKGFDFSELDPDISLIDKNLIKKIADTENEANTLMGLSIETSNIGWLSNSRTSFYSNPNHKYDGDTKYVGGNNPSAPTLLFYLYHSKNISEAGEMGSVTITLDSIRQVDALNKETKQLLITVNMDRVLYDTVNYEGAMTAGRKYDLFTSTATNITSSSSISAYYSLFNVGASIYRTGYHRSLVSDYIFPLDTKITMIDLSGTNPEYYYKTITQADVTAAENQMRLNREVSYNLSMFEAMGAQNSGVYYDDVQKNIDYCAAGNYCNEDFIFIIDFGDTTINSNELNNKLLIEIRDNNDQTIYSVLAPQHGDLIYSIYANKDAVIDMSGTLSTNKIYLGETFTADMHIDYTQSMVGSITIYDTHYFDSKLGIKISLIDSDGDVVKGSTLLGLYYQIDGVRYYPNIDGTARVKVADKVDSAEKWIIINTGTSTIPSGQYKLRIESFGSPDGIYYGLESSDTVDFNIEIVNEIYGLDVETTPEEMIIKSQTGLNANGEDTIIYNITYNSGLTNPSIKFKMYRRKYDRPDNNTFTLVNASDYFKNTFRGGTQTNEYTLIDDPNDTTSFTFITKDDLTTGTYRMQFILYDGNSAIGSVEKYIIIK